MLGFEAFVAAARPYSPYPWQTRFANALAAETDAAEAARPLWITAPTGAGKTTAIDAAVWALAMQAERAPTARTVGVRLVWVIDRRLLVDQVHEQARALADRLRDALSETADPLHDPALRLLALAADGRWTPAFDPAAAIEKGFSPLETGRWRGGVPTAIERLSPFQPTVITSTVDQVGSRLLFRGYGVSRGSRAVEAALAARDTLVFLDEAHLATPFAETVNAVIDHQKRQPRERMLLPPALRLATLTATPPNLDQGRHRIFGLQDEDRRHDHLSRRLCARKRVRTVPAGDKPPHQLTDLALDALSATPDGKPAVVAVVANRVRVATQVFQRLQAAAARRDDDPVVALLIGPQRAVDRRRQLAGIYDWVFGDATPDRPVALVATQTFEVGLDADVSHLITQSASVAALVQRFGRVNRAGQRELGEITVVRDERFPLYAEDEPEAWAWLQGIEAEGGDVSVAALMDRERPRQSSPTSAPMLTDLIVQQLAQTSAALSPWAEPDVDGLLHGVGDDPARDVTVAWRADLLAEGPGRFASSRDGYRRALVALAPPHRDECLSLPIAAVRQLIAGEPGAEKRVVDEADVPRTSADGDARQHDAAWPFVVIRGSDVLAGTDGRAQDDNQVAVRDLRPGDVVVLPTEAGGIDDAGLRPGVSPATECRVDRDPEVGPCLPWLRVTPGALSDVLPAEQWRELASAIASELAPDDGDAAILPRDPRPGPRWLELLAPDGMPGRDALARTLGEDEWVARPLRSAAPEDTGETETAPAGWVLRRISAASRPEDRLDPRDQPPPTLDQHCVAVAERADRWARALDAAPEVIAAIRLAGLAHDLGKADPRIQAWFAGGTAPFGSPPLAKSTFGTADPVRSRRAADQAGMPRHLRHEIASVAALADALSSGTVPGFAADADRELALHLVGTHHGSGRPTFPVPDGGTPVPPWVARVESIRGAARGDGMDGWQDGAWEQRFWTLHDRFGPWTLAYLEALVILADRTVSREGR